LLAKLRLECLPKVSGSKGIQIYVPLNSAVTYEKTNGFAHMIADLLSRDYPALIVSQMAKMLRRNKVFIDWSQNTQSKTTVGVYSLRAKRERPFVSMPVKWEELKKAIRTSDSERLFFEPGAALTRLKKQGDLFAAVLKVKQQLPREYSQIR
jgi:bifunctional non-homologous end joining protein LigD